jgi:hypothetical protein
MSKFYGTDDVAYAFKGAYFKVAHDISSSEYETFILENEGSDVPYFFMDGEIFAPTPQTQAANESLIHEAASSFFTGLASVYNEKHNQKLILSTGAARQRSENFSRAPDFGFNARSRKSITGTFNVVGEVCYSTGLVHCHGVAARFLEVPGILAVILIYIPYPWPVDGSGRLLSEGKLVYVYYEKDHAVEGQGAIPTVVKSFGNTPLDEHDVVSIAATLNVSQGIITGYKHDNLVPCDGDNAGYIERIPGRIVLNTIPNENAITLPGRRSFSIESLPQEFDLSINLRRLQEDILDAVSITNATRG